MSVPDLASLLPAKGQPQHPRSRLLVVSALALVMLAAANPVAAQSRSDDYADLEEEILQQGKNNVTVGVRVAGRAKVKFNNLGTITTDYSLGSATGEASRTYYDGYVSTDSRTTSDGADIPNDGRTNTWSYYSTSQVLEDESGIAFNAYSTTTTGASMSATSGASPAFDMEFGRQLGERGRMAPDLSPKWAWGVMLGVGLEDINAKTRGDIKATLTTTTDVYSLLGSAVPYDDDTTDGVAYSAPSTTSTTITNSDGTTTTVTLDTTTLLGNSPESRTTTVTVDGADIYGFWQVRGASLMLRTGPWLRWQPSERLAIKVSGGGFVDLIGLKMRFDERMKVGTSSTELIEADASRNKGFALPGYFAGVDAEFWLTGRTGVYGGASYEVFLKDDIDLAVDERTSSITLEGGLSLRMGVSTRF